MKTKLNIQLLTTLPRVLRMTHNEVSEASGISIACWYRIAKNPEKITVQQLLGLSNGIHIPVSCFFSSDKACLIGVREDYILQDYQNCYYDSEAVRRRIGEGSTTSWRKAAEAVGMHWTNVSSSLLAVSRTPVVRLLALCEAFNFNLFDFLIDPNKNPKHRRANRQHASQDGDDAALHQEIATLHQEIDKLDAAVDDLTKKFQSMLERHNRLEQILCEHFKAPIDTAADSAD